MTAPSLPPVYFLLVDDREQNLHALQALLVRDGLELLTARSGAEALELLLRYEVALALVDVQMPEMDGFELAELMRGTERTRLVPIIFLTAGHADQQRRFRGYETGAVDFLQKPVEPDVLRSKAGVFFELGRQRQQVARQRDELAMASEENARLLAESRKYAQALEEADRRKDEFLATLAHELRNPLAPILNAVQVLRMAESPQELEQLQEIIERQVSHMVRLVDDLLDVSRITGGKIKLQREVVDLAEIARHAIETSVPLLTAARHKFSQSTPGEPLLVEADKVRLAQVLTNLLNNAAKYTPEAGEISLEAVREGDWAVISVRDSGLGIPPKMLDRVFDMFTQVNRHLKRAQGGLGIGLALAKRLVEMHGGSIAATSAGEGQGSTFVIRLPMARTSATAGTDAKGRMRHRPADGRRVLLIDDNADALNTLNRLLTLLGHEVATAPNGLAGIDQLVAFRPEAVFLDLGMPGMDGFETARRLRALPEGEKVTLVALTGWGQDEDRSRTREAGFDYHLVKPIDTTDLQQLFASLERPG